MLLIGCSKFSAITKESLVASVWNFGARSSDVISAGTSGDVAKCRSFSQAMCGSKFGLLYACHEKSSSSGSL